LSGFLRRIAITLQFIKVLFGKKHTHEKVTIRGNDEFIGSTIEALELLKEKAPEAHELVLKYIGEIVSVKPSGVFTDMLKLGPTFVFIGSSYSEGPAVEYAGALAHEAYHCELYMKAKRGNLESRVPRNAYAGERPERLCLQYQCDVLRKLGVDEDRIKEYESQLHTKWWEVPFERQDW